MKPFERLGELLQARGERLNLMRQMAQVSGAKDALDIRQCGDPTLRAIVQECTRCQQAPACAAWLAEAHESSPPPAFCANAIPFRYLASQLGRGIPRLN